MHCSEKKGEERLEKRARRGFRTTGERNDSHGRPGKTDLGNRPGTELFSLARMTLASAGRVWRKGGKGRRGLEIRASNLNYRWHANVRKQPWKYWGVNCIRQPRIRKGEGEKDLVF